MKRKDFYMMGLFLLIAGALLFFFKPGRNAPPVKDATSYLRVQVGNETDQVIPLNESRQVTVRQEDGKVNVIQIDENAAHMFSSTCKNQECVHQGTVTLDNRDSRALYNMIICLPNKVLLELLTTEEAVTQGYLPDQGNTP